MGATLRPETNRSSQPPASGLTTNTTEMNCRSWCRQWVISRSRPNASTLSSTTTLGKRDQCCSPVFFSNMAHASDSCEAQAAELSRAVKNSFLKKFQKDAAAAAKATCESQAAESETVGNGQEQRHQEIAKGCDFG
jgi:hypothetical protein